MHVSDVVGGCIACLPLRFVILVSIWIYLYSFLCSNFPGRDCGPKVLGQMRLRKFCVSFAVGVFCDGVLVVLKSRRLYMWRGRVLDLMDVSKNRGVSPKMDGLSWKTLLKLMIWRYPYFGNTHMLQVTDNCALVIKGSQTAISLSWCFQRRNLPLQCEKTLRCKTQHNLWQPSVIFFPTREKCSTANAWNLKSSTFGANPTMLRAWSVGLTFFLYWQKRISLGTSP